MAATCRVVIAEDDVLMREGIARLLTEAGFDVVAQAATAEDLVRKADECLYQAKAQGRNRVVAPKE